MLTNFNKLSLESLLILTLMNILEWSRLFVHDRHLFAKSGPIRQNNNIENRITHSAMCSTYVQPLSCTSPLWN